MTPFTPKDDKVQMSDKAAAWLGRFLPYFLQLSPLMQEIWIFMLKHEISPEDMFPMVNKIKKYRL